MKQPLFRRLPALVLILALLGQAGALAVQDDPDASYSASLTVLNADGAPASVFQPGNGSADQPTSIVRVACALDKGGSSRENRLYCVQLEITYDPTCLRFEGTEGLADGFVQGHPKAGRVILAFLDYSGDGRVFPADLAVATLRFTALRDAAAEFALDRDTALVTNADATARPLALSAPRPIAIGSGVEVADKNTLRGLLSAARQEADGTLVSEKGADAYNDQKWVTQAQMDALRKVLDAAGLVYQDGAALQAEIDEACTGLRAALETFFTQQSPGLLSRAVTYRMTCRQSEGGTVTVSAANAVRGSSQTFTIRPDEGWRIEDVLVNGRSVGPVRYYTVADVRESYTVSAIFAPKPDPEDWVNPFRDMAADAWYFDAVRECSIEGLIKGTSESTFSPAQPLTRAAFLTLLCRLEGGGIQGQDTENPCSDVSEDAWYYPAVLWGLRSQIAVGGGDGLFRPDAVISRQEMAVMMARYLDFAVPGAGSGGEAPKFPDEGAFASWARESILRCGALGLLQGGDGGNFLPDASATRGEAAVVLQRLLHL
ncbi:S-layer homology domain-containing protein [Pseudoflavonifractor phocaeensis]|uniref:S-layer homology domain-containing protein n=1 Tax=Pseudoflavonifractor phocaeensis TaxID=1870988 RepID=UPI00210D4494|nr:S-layer homology domain-containing protein [Pseudoflavonifractor phocaeensis]